MKMVRTFCLAFPLVALAATSAPAQTLVALTVQSTPDAEGLYTFEANAGDVISINRQFTPGHEDCYPDFESNEGLSVMGDSLDLTPYSETLVVQADESGLYQYSVPTGADGHQLCDVTVQLAPTYQQLWVEADNLSDEEGMLEQSLALFNQVIEAEQRYPEPYKQRIGLLLELNVSEPAEETLEDPDAIGQILAAIPDPAQQTMSDDLNHLAEIYENSPAWQTDEYESPAFLRDFADFIETGVASDLVKELMFPEAEEESGAAAP